ncbi:MAG TPA: choice-of-anchor tandem repeat GloVer-containing protein [Capsulimonadaceae bacterium]|nr:choice-of-anchor tandem repeat GloVer-containing protein [Capsulimonadaceae bacterium]
MINLMSFRSVRSVSIYVLLFIVLFASLGMFDNADVARASTIGSPAFNPIYQFPAQQGSYPVSAPILASDGNIYGTAFTGGKFGYGVIYKVTPSGSVSVVHAFTGGNDGAYPRGALVEVKPGVMYGVASMGGAFSFGNIFKFGPSGALTNLHSFAGFSADGSFPNNVTLGVDGKLYGTTFSGGSGGSGSLWGTIFSFNPANAKYKVVYNFTGGTDGGHIGGTVAEDSSDVLYTTTQNGGANGFGTIDAIKPTDHEVTLHAFTGTDGSTAESGVILLNGILYGTAAGGGANGQGVAFSVNTSGTGYMDLHDFGAPGDGATPTASFCVGPNGNLYSTTAFGGAFASGSIFSMTPSGAVTITHSFLFIDGTEPLGGVTLGNDGKLYGAAYDGKGDGTIFNIDTSQNYAILGSLPSPDGSAPLGALVEVSPGVFWGTTDHGGSNGAGVVFQVTSSGAYSIIHNFKFTDGAFPKAGLTLFNGFYYGTTRRGGNTFDLATDNRGDGVVFRISPAGVFQVIHDFKGTDGSQPFSPMAVGSDGNLYGTASTGGLVGDGDVFRLTTANKFTDVHNFKGTDGNDPIGSLLLASDGNLYGTTIIGGTSGIGTIYSISPTGAFKSIYSFNFGTDGFAPHAGLVQDGSLLYGVTNLGGSFGFGAAFSVDPTTTPATVNGIYQFQGLADGSAPIGTLVAATDGNLYGTTSQGGGTRLVGTIFQLTPAGNLTTEYTFTGGVTDGGIPEAPLIEGSDGNLYGTTTNQGGGGLGTVFQLATGFP